MFIKLLPKYYKSLNFPRRYSSSIINTYLNNNNGKIYNIEKLSGITDYTECVNIRRNYYKEKHNIDFKNIGLNDFNYKQILNKNCENVIGHVKIPVGIIGPLNVNNNKYFVPLATTEGALVGSIHRGCNLINKTSLNGISAVSIDKGITRAPLIELPDIRTINSLYNFIENNFETLKTEFESTTRYGKLTNISLHHNGNKVHVRLNALTGDAMGMNIITKGSEKVMNYLMKEFPTIKLLSLSGNVCTDKKPSAINWINGRSKTVIVNTKLDISLLEQAVNQKIENIVKLNIQKNLIGSALAGSIGGYNSHAANIVAAIFVATGQDIAQIGTSSVCISDYTIEGNHLNIDITMPSLEVATIGGGTSLDNQESCLELMGINKNNNSKPGENSLLLSKIIASTVLCGELSLMSSLSSGTLVDSHMKLNRGKV